MFPCNVSSRVLMPAALLVLSCAVPRGASAQAANQAPATDASTSVSAHPTAEQVGDSLESNKRYQAAIAAYATAPQMTAKIWNKMGIAYQMMFNTKDAVRCYKASLKMEPRDAQVLNNLGTVYATLKEYGQADRMYRRALKISPGSAVTLKNLGTNQLAERKYSQGWDAYQRALAIDPHIFSDHLHPRTNSPSSVQELGAMNYYMALGCARAGYTNCALEYLRRAMDEGFTDRKKVESNSEFASLRGSPEFKQLIAEETRQ